jgi:hypothetical protein
MKKNLFTTFSIAFLFALCFGSLNAQNFTGTIPSTGAIPAEFLTSASDDATAGEIAPALVSSRGNIARSNIVYPSTKYVSFDVDNILGNTTITTAFHSYGGAFYNGIFYAFDNESVSGNPGPTTFYIINSATGVITSTIPRSELYGQIIGALSYDYTSNTMYAVKGGGPNVLYTVNLETGQLTQVANIGGISGYALAMAIHLNGNMYALEASPTTPDAKLYSINKTTGSATLIGSTGQYMNFAQAMAFDYNDPDCPLYWGMIAQPSTIVSNWNKVNITTGAATIIQASPSLELTGLHFPYDPGYLPCDPATNLNVTYNTDCEATLTWTAPSVPAPYNVYRDGTQIASAITETTYIDKDFDIYKSHTWDIIVVCESEESDPVSKTLEACSCKPISDGAVAFSGNTATLTWTTVDGATGYEVTREGTHNVTAPPYTEENDFEDGTEYAWTVVTVCTHGKSDPFEIKAIYVGVHEIGFETFSMIPNPAQNEISIKSNLDFQKVEIINFLGQTVISQSVGQNFVKLDISNLTGGVYFVRVASENGTNVKKFVKQ